MTKKLSLCLIDKRICALTTNQMVWECEPAVRDISIQLSSGELITAPVPWPRLVICATAGRSLRVMAVRKRGEIEGNTKLYHAPLMNIDRDGVLDVNPSTLPSRIDPKSLAEWEALIFGYLFANVGHEQTLIPVGMRRGAKINTYYHTRFWRWMINNSVSAFPGESLSDRKLTLQQWIEILGT